jgi:lysophospholipase L1-like esterase
VIALGTNDVGAYAEKDQYGELIDSILAMIPEDTPVVWVDVYRPREAEYAAMFNEVLAERLEERGNAVVASWSDVVSGDESLLRHDRIHPNADGSAAFAEVVLDGLARLND